MFARARATLVAALAVAATLAAVTTATTSTASAAGGSASANATGRPTPGTCRTMSLATFDNGQHDTTAPVSCGKRHNAYVEAVVTLPASLDVKTASTAELSKAANTLCYAAWKKFRGGNNVKASLVYYGSGFFTPTDAQIQAGARWAECVVVIPSATKLMPLPKLVKPLLDHAQPKVAQRCITGTGHYAPCTLRHKLHAWGAFNVKGSSYPSKATFAKAAQRCHTITKTKRWSYTMPSKADWKAGYHVLVCYKPTTK